jgi:hypothetical protein
VARIKHEDMGRPIGPGCVPFHGVKLFSATKHMERDQLGETITRWLDAHPEIEVVDRTVTQSSDQAFHCITITLFYNRKP